MLILCHLRYVRETLGNFYGVRYQPKYLYIENPHYMQEKCAVWERFQNSNAQKGFLVRDNAGQLEIPNFKDQCRGRDVKM